jgi:hypothetical protein
MEDGERIWKPDIPYLAHMWNQYIEFRRIAVAGRRRHKVDELRHKRQLDPNFQKWLADLGVGHNLHLDSADLAYFHNKLILKQQLEKSWSDSDPRRRFSYILYDLQGWDYMAYKQTEKKKDRERKWWQHS